MQSRTLNQLERLKSSGENLVLATLDLGFSLIPQNRPQVFHPDQCRIVSHRCRINKNRGGDNSVHAIEQLQLGGVSAVEFDIRWTKDGIPVLHHDQTILKIRLSDLTLSELKSMAPQISTLTEALAVTKSQTTLFVEVKEHSKSNKDLSNLIDQLSPRLADLNTYVMDFDFLRLLSLPIPRGHLVSIGVWNMDRLLEDSIAAEIGGATGPYWRLSNRKIHLARKAHLKVGTGFIDSKNLLYRELNRGVDWLFSDCPDRLLPLL